MKNVDFTKREHTDQSEDDYEYSNFERHLIDMNSKNKQSNFELSSEVENKIIYKLSKPSEESQQCNIYYSSS